MTFVEQGTTLYITKFATTVGIIEAPNRQPSRTYGRTTYVSAYLPHRQFNESFRLGHSAFTDRAEAEANAEKRRAARIAGLKRQIAKLEGIDLSAPKVA